MLEIARTGLALFFLLYASWSDYKTREVSNTVWLFFAPPAFALTLIEFFFYGDSSSLFFYALCFGLTSAFAVILFYSGGFGGADAKALMCLALALPFYPQNLRTPLLWDISPISEKFFPITVFSNSVLFAGAMAIIIFSKNIWHKIRGERLFEEHKHKHFWTKFLVLITGYKVHINELKKKCYLLPLEDVEIVDNNIKRKMGVLPKDENREATVERLDKAIKDGVIKDMIWATPGLPMLIYVTIGLVTALLFGDIIWTIVRFFLG